MEIGDIVFIKGARKKSTQIVWGQWLYVSLFHIKNFCNTKELLHGQFSHIAMYVGYGTFIEAYPNKKNGVRFSKFNDIFNPIRTDANWQVYRNKEFYHQADKIIQNTQQFLEKKFEMRYKKGSNETYFCSKLIYSILKDIDYFDMPNITDAHKVYPDHFHTLVTTNRHKLWEKVTKEYKLDTTEAYFLTRTAHENMRSQYHPILQEIYKDRKVYANIRFYELTDHTISNFFDLQGKISDNTATREERYEYYMIQDVKTEHSCIATSFNRLACFWSAYAK